VAADASNSHDRPSPARPLMLRLRTLPTHSLEHRATVRAIRSVARRALFGAPSIPGLTGNPNDPARRDRANPGQQQPPVLRLHIEFAFGSTPHHQHALNDQLCCDKPSNPTVRYGVKVRPTLTKDPRRWSPTSS
jgi:hypothetical protein